MLTENLFRKRLGETAKDGNGEREWGAISINFNCDDAQLHTFANIIDQYSV